MSEAMPQEVKAIMGAADAAVTWWRGLKPKGWSVKKHLANPLVNCTTYREKLLARRASRWFAACNPAIHGSVSGEAVNTEEKR